MKTTEESRVGARFLVHSTLGGRGGVLELRDGIRKNEKHLFTHTDLHKTKQQVG